MKPPDPDNYVVRTDRNQNANAPDKPSGTRTVEPEILRIGRTLEAMSPERQSATLVHWLTKGSGTRWDVAIRVVRRAGGPAVDLLVHHALLPRKRQTYRIQLLLAVEQSGHPLPIGSWLSLYNAVPIASPAVREQILRVLAAHHGRLSRQVPSAA